MIKIENKNNFNLISFKSMKVSYQGDIVVNLGNELAPTQTKDTPTVTWEAEKGAYYTLIKVDPDAPSRAKPTYREIRHWLVMMLTFILMLK